MTVGGWKPNIRTISSLISEISLVELSGRGKMSGSLTKQNVNKDGNNLAKGGGHCDVIAKVSAIPAVKFGGEKMGIWLQQELKKR